MRIIDAQVSLTDAKLKDTSPGTAAFALFPITTQRALGAHGDRFKGADRIWILAASHGQGIPGHASGIKWWTTRAIFAIWVWRAAFAIAGLSIIVLCGITGPAIGREALCGCEVGDINTAAVFDGGGLTSLRADHDLNQAEVFYADI